MHETVRLGREFWSCVLDMYGWIDVNSKFISLKLKLLLSQGAITACVVPQVWGYPVGDRGGLSNGITLEHVLRGWLCGAEREDFLQIF